MTTTGPRTAAWFAAAAHGRADIASVANMANICTPTNQCVSAAYTEYVNRVTAWHRVVPLADGAVSAMCSCGAYAVMCAYLRAAHDILGHPVPWDTANPPDPYRGA